MFCDNKECSIKTFSETFKFIEYKAKKTNRLIEYIQNLALNISSNRVSVLLKKDVLNIGKSTVCNILKKISNFIDYKTPTNVCIDDFVFKIRHTYGTILIGANTRKIIDLLDSRDVDLVAK